MNNWKSIKIDGLPPIGVPLMVTVFDTFKNQRQLRYPVYYEKNEYTQKFWWRWTSIEGISELIPEYSEVIAWCEIPQPYEGD